MQNQARLSRYEPPERVSSGLRELQPSSPVFQQTPSFQALESNPIHLSLEKLGTCFNVSFSDGLRRGSGVFGLSIAGRSLYRTGADHRPPRSISCTRGDATLTGKSRGNNPRRAGRRLETVSGMVRPCAGSYPSVAKLGRGLAVQGPTFVQPISLMQAERPITGQIAPIFAVPVA